MTIATQKTPKQSLAFQKNLLYLLQWKPFKNHEKMLFCFNLKPLFLLKIFKYLSWLFGHVEKTAWLGGYKNNFEIDGVTAWLTNNYSTHISQYLPN